MIESFIGDCEFTGMGWEWSFQVLRGHISLYSVLCKLLFHNIMENCSSLIYNPYSVRLCCKCSYSWCDFRAWNHGKDWHKKLEGGFCIDI